METKLEPAAWLPWLPKTKQNKNAQLNKSPQCYLSDERQLTVRIEWVDSLLLFSHLYNNYDALATTQRLQIR